MFDSIMNETKLYGPAGIYTDAGSFALSGGIIVELNVEGHFRMPHR